MLTAIIARVKQVKETATPIIREATEKAVVTVATKVEDCKDAWNNHEKYLTKKEEAVKEGKKSLLQIAKEAREARRAELAKK